MKYNLHTHTFRCNHAEGGDREYVEAAVKAGIKVLGFSDHCPQFFPDESYYSFFRMRPGLCEDYVKSVLALKKEYAGEIKIFLGLEAEYYPQTFEKFAEFISAYPFDYLLLGEHFVGNEYDKEKFYAGKSDGELLKIYVDQVIEGLSTGKFACLAHPDNLWYRGEPGYYTAEMTRLCNAAKALGVPLEYNMLGYINRRCYPNPAFWEIAAKTGNKAVIGFDAHSPEMLLNSAVYDECAGNLRRFGLEPENFNDINLRTDRLRL